MYSETDTTTKQLQIAKFVNFSALCHLLLLITRDKNENNEKERKEKHTWKQHLSTSSKYYREYYMLYSTLVHSTLMT